MIRVADGRGGMDFVNGLRRRHLVGDVHLPLDRPMTVLADTDGTRVWLATDMTRPRS